MTDGKATLLAWIDRDRDRLVDFLRQLVRAPSENPPGDTTAAAELVGRFLAERGLGCRTIAPNPVMPNLVASFEGGAPGPHLVLNGHLDVFPTGDPALWRHAPLGAEVAEGAVWGRGVADMKAGTSALVSVYAYLHAMRAALRGRLTLAIVSDEETFGPWGARYLMEHHPEVHGDACLNAECSALDTVRFGERGLLWFELGVATPGGHGAFVHLSPNAIEIASRLVADLRALEALPVDTPGAVRAALARAGEAIERAFGAGAGQILSRVTVNCGTIAGGLKLNMIAAECRLEVDVRLPIGTGVEAVEDAVRRLVARYPEASYRRLNATEPAWTDPEHPLLRHVRANARALRGIDPVPVVSLGNTDARLWRQRGIPAVVYGPVPTNMGRPDERVPIADYLDVVRVHALSAYDYLTG